MTLHNQRLLADHIRQIAKEPDVFAFGDARFRHLLNDYLPGLSTERFLVSCVFEMPRFVSVLKQGRVERADISRVEFFCTAS